MRNDNENLLIFTRPSPECIVMMIVMVFECFPPHRFSFCAGLIAGGEEG